MLSESNCHLWLMPKSGKVWTLHRQARVSTVPLCRAELLSVNSKQKKGQLVWRRVACAVSFIRKIPTRRDGRLVAIGTRNICSNQLENRWGVRQESS